tara:strand:+ start:49 stop:486 length:438 start_codon:yes stop_codon:yes gene_type:complete
MLDRNLIGKKYNPVIFTVTDQRLRFFAKATGQTDPIYFDHDAALSEGYNGIVCPPTFLYAVSMEQKYPFEFLNDLKIKIESILHAEQEFLYEKMICSGDTLTMTTEIVDMYDKKEGLLQFLILESTFIDQNNMHTATMKNTIVVK